MGCTSCSLISEENYYYQQETIKLDVSNNIKDLSYASSLINLITRLRNRIIYLYHKLIYDTGACIFIKPNISHCLDCIFYKVSSEFEGNLKNADITHREDPPYLQLSKEVVLSKQSKSLFDELFNFIIEIISYKTIIKQIDKEIPELLYLIHEEKDKISKNNITLINKGIELFKNTKIIKNEILNKYKNQVCEFAFRKEQFCENIDAIGKYAFDKNITDIYEIVMIQKKDFQLNNNKNIKNEMFKNVHIAKLNMENIINNEINDEIIEAHESIIENCNNSNIN